VGWLRRADEVVHLVGDPVARELIETWHPTSHHALEGMYGHDRARRDSYDAMVDFVLSRLAQVDLLCLALYGHPGVFASVGHRAIANARELGAQAWMEPAISSEDCLFADLSIDPAERGCVSLDATDFLVHQLAIDPAFNLVLWQIGVVGRFDDRGAPEPVALRCIVEKLRLVYEPTHTVAVYEAATLPTQPPDVQWLRLDAIPDARLGRGSTLFVPAAAERRPDPRFASARPMPRSS
jgi:hypothetical protein